MKSALLILICLCPLYFKSAAQTQKALFSVSVPDASSKSVFSQNSKLERINIRYNNGEPAIIDIYELSEARSQVLKERYYTSFEGDCYAIGKLYPDLRLPQLPKFDFYQFAGIKNLRDSLVQYEVVTDLKRDTLIHTVRYFVSKSTTYMYSFFDPFTYPRLKVTDSEFQEKLTVAYKKWKPVEVADSTLIIAVNVKREGLLDRVDLIMGKPSPFSDHVVAFIKKEATSWWPGKIKTKRIDLQTRVFARLNHDDTITFSTL